MQQPEGGSLKEAIRQPEGSNPELVLHPEHPELTRGTLSCRKAPRAVQRHPELELHPGHVTLARLGGGRAAAFECPQPFLEAFGRSCLGIHLRTEYSANNWCKLEVTVSDAASPVACHADSGFRASS